MAVFISVSNSVIKKVFLKKKKLLLGALSWTQFPAMLCLTYEHQKRHSMNKVAGNTFIIQLIYFVSMRPNCGYNCASDTKSKGEMQSVRE